MATKVNSYKLTLPFLVSCLKDVPWFHESIQTLYGRFLFFLIRHLKKVRKQLKTGDTKIQSQSFLILMRKDLEVSFTSFSNLINELRNHLQSGYFKDREQ